MEIKQKIALDLIYCYKQINLCHGREIIKVQDFGEYSVFELENKYYITNSDDILKESKEICDFIEDFYYRVRKGEIIIYPIEIINGLIMRFDGFLFIFYDVVDRTPKSLDINQVSPAMRAQYFEKVLQNDL